METFVGLVTIRLGGMEIGLVMCHGVRRRRAAVLVYGRAEIVDQHGAQINCQHGVEISSDHLSVDQGRKLSHLPYKVVRCDDPSELARDAGGKHHAAEREVHGEVKAAEARCGRIVLVCWGWEPTRRVVHRCGIWGAFSYVGRYALS